MSKKTTVKPDFYCHVERLWGIIIYMMLLLWCILVLQLCKWQSPLSIRNQNTKKLWADCNITPVRAKGWELV